MCPGPHPTSRTDSLPRRPRRPVSFLAAFFCVSDFSAYSSDTRSNDISHLPVLDNILPKLRATYLWNMFVPRIRAKEEVESDRGITPPVSYTHLRAHETRHDL